MIEHSPFVMGVKDMAMAGEVFGKDSASDFEIELAVHGTRMALAYLTGRGSWWSLATTALRLDLESMERILELRKSRKPS